MRGPAFFAYADNGLRCLPQSWRDYRAARAGTCDQSRAGAARCTSTRRGARERFLTERSAARNESSDLTRPVTWMQNPAEFCDPAGV